jgi:hypothetical protein
MPLDGKVPPFGGINSGLPEVAEGSEGVKEAESLHNRPVELNRFAVVFFRHISRVARSSLLPF